MAELRPAMCDTGGSIPELEDEITWEEVHAAIRRLPNGKAPGPDGIVGELLRLAGLGFEFTLASIFNDIWRSLEWPEEWGLATLIPLYKKAGDVRDPSSYRMLALASTIPKVFERILDERIRAWSDRVGCLSDLQGGFRAGRGTEDQ